MAPEAMVDAMIDVQRARDATLADVVARARRGATARVLIAGAGHVRRDRGAPLYLERRAPTQQRAGARVQRGRARRRRSRSDPAARAARLGASST